MTSIPDELADLDPFDLMDTEYARLEAFFGSLDGPGWTLPTRCEGWRVRELVAHLAGSEDYNHACLDDRLDELFAEAKKAGVDGLHQFNDWQVRKRADLRSHEVFEEFQQKGAETRRRMRELGPEATMTTSVGPYPVSLQAFHLAHEAATHADDCSARVPSEEAEGRLEWRARWVRWALANEHDPPLEIEQVMGANRVVVDGKELMLLDGELVEAAMGRLPDDHPMHAERRAAIRIVS